MINKTNFKTGDVGNLVSNLAKEHLFNSYNPDLAIKTIKQSFCDITSKISLEVLIGRKLLVTVEDGVNLIDNDSFDIKKLTKWYSGEINYIDKTMGDFLNILIDLDLKTNQDLKNMNINVSFINIFKSISSLNEHEDLLKEISSNENLTELVFSLETTAAYLKKVIKIQKTLIWLVDKYPEIFNYQNGCEIQLLQKPILVEKRLYEILDRFTLLGIIGSEKYDELLDFKIYNKNTSSKCLMKLNNLIVFGKADITKKYDAGWLSPSGEYYATNGEYSDLLHDKICEYLEEIKIIPHNVENLHLYLEDHGWIKIHKERIFHAGSCLDKPVDLTIEQIEKIKLYGNICYRGVLIFGFRANIIPAVRLGMMDKFAIRKLFSY